MWVSGTCISEQTWRSCVHPPSPPRDNPRAPFLPSQAKRPRSTSSTRILAIPSLCSAGAGLFRTMALLQLLCSPDCRSNCLHLLWAVSHAPFSCLLPQPQYSHTRNTPPTHTLLEFLSCAASASQEICSALFSRFLTVFKGLLIPVCLKNAEHSLPYSFSALPSVSQSAPVGL